MRHGVSVVGTGYTRIVQSSDVGIHCSSYCIFAMCCERHSHRISIDSADYDGSKRLNPNTKGKFSLLHQHIHSHFSLICDYFSSLFHVSVDRILFLLSPADFQWTFFFGRFLDADDVERLPELLPIAHLCTK